MINLACFFISLFFCLRVNTKYLKYFTPYLLRTSLISLKFGEFKRNIFFRPPLNLFLIFWQILWNALVPKYCWRLAISSVNAINSLLSILSLKVVSLDKVRFKNKLNNIGAEELSWKTLVFVEKVFGPYFIWVWKNSLFNCSVQNSTMVY